MTATVFAKTSALWLLSRFSRTLLVSLNVQCKTPGTLLPVSNFSVENVRLMILWCTEFVWRRKKAKSRIWVEERCYRLPPQLVKQGWCHKLQHLCLRVTTRTTNPDACKMSSIFVVVYGHDVRIANCVQARAAHRDAGPDLASGPGPLPINLAQGALLRGTESMQNLQRGKNFNNYPKKLHFRAWASGGGGRGGQVSSWFWNLLLLLQTFFGTCFFSLGLVLVKWNFTTVDVLLQKPFWSPPPPGKIHYRLAREKKSFRRPCFRGFVIRRYPQRTARLPEPSPGRTSTPAGKCIPLVRDTGNRLAGQRRTRCPRPWPGPGERGTCGPGPCIVPGRILCPRSGGTTGRFRCSALLCHKGRRESSGRARKNRARCREVTLELRTTDFF